MKTYALVQWWRDVRMWKHLERVVVGPDKGALERAGRAWEAQHAGNQYEVVEAERWEEGA